MSTCGNPISSRQSSIPLHRFSHDMLCIGMAPGVMNFSLAATLITEPNCWSLAYSTNRETLRPAIYLKIHKWCAIWFTNFWCLSCCRARRFGSNSAAFSCDTQWRSQSFSTAGALQPPRLERTKASAAIEREPSGQRQLSVRSCRRLRRHYAVQHQTSQNSGPSLWGAKTQGCKFSLK
jgi:hypothetical protein